MNKFKKIVFVLLGVLLLAGCGKGAGKLETASYKLEGVPGTTSTITFEYDKDKNIQKATTETKVNITESGQTKEVFEQTLETYKNMYDNMKGVKHTADLSDKEMSEKLEITVKDVSTESLPVLFSTSAKDGKVSLDDYTKSIKSLGYVKK